MIKVLAFLAIVALHVACTRQEGRTKSEGSNYSAGNPIHPESTHNSLPSPNEKDLKRLDERFPNRMVDILENASRIQILETEICAPGKGFSLSSNETSRFQGCKILRQANITDPERRKQFIEELKNAIMSSDSGAACFSPRHGIRADHQGARIEMLICFECGNFRGSSSFGNFGGGLSSHLEKRFSRILNSEEMFEMINAKDSIITKQRN